MDGWVDEQANGGWTGISVRALLGGWVVGEWVRQL